MNDKKVLLKRYRILPSGTDVIAGFVKACRERKRQRKLCTVAIEM
jgi:hypothetical protein